MIKTEMKLVLTSLFILIAIEAYFAPFTKVEESFNLQATYDILHTSSKYDHFDFPGVVPRTFFGAAILSFISWPFIWFLPLLEQQVMVRIMLGAINVLSLAKFSTGVTALFGSNTATVTILLFLCQFHLVFWSSRTLPNMFALPWVNLGLGHWLKSLSQSTTRTVHLNYMIRYLTFAGIVFRFEVGILLMMIILSEYIYGNNVTIGNTLKQIIATSIISLIISVPLDSFFWNEWIWPEGIVFYFNAILNKSSEWGTLPFYAYFTSFLPRLLLISFPLALFGYLNDIRVRRILSPMFLYVTIFSCLPHKEWRFIVYTIPVFTCAAAYSVTWFITNARRSLFYRILSILILFGTIISFMISISLFQISRHNYPGGEALYTLHQIEKEKSNDQVSVHIDTETAMTGASLYGQLYYPDWTYSKNESHHSEQDFIDAHYTHLITATPNKFDTSSLFEIIDQTYGLDKIRLKTPKEYIESIKSFDFSPISIHLSPKLYTLKLVNPQKTWIQSTLRKYPVVLYSKTYCPYCKAAKQLIKKYCPSIQTIEVDLEKDGSNIQRALYELTGQYTFPNLFKSGKSLGGYDRLSELDRKGQLNDLC